MENGIIDTNARIKSSDDRQIYSVLPAQVINNVDERREGMVQVRIGSALGQEQWVRVAAPLAGPGRGICFFPQVGDEVLVAFYNGHPTDSYIIGSLWNRQDSLPPKIASDPVNQSMIRTPAGHEIAFDDKAKEITISGVDGGRIHLAPKKIEIAIGGASITLEKNGNIRIKATNTITLEAKTIDVLAKENVAIGGNKSVRIDGGGNCSINAGKIDIG